MANNNNNTHNTPQFYLPAEKVWIRANGEDIVGRVDHFYPNKDGFVWVRTEEYGLLRLCPSEVEPYEFP